MISAKIRSGLLLTLLATTSALATERHVASTGNDGNPGTAQSPLATLEAARDSLRALRAGEVDKTIRHTVILHSGMHRRVRTFELDERDSHTTYKAKGEAPVRLHGGIEIPAGAARPVTDLAVLGRIVEEKARPNVRMIDLKALGNANCGKLSPRGFRRAYSPAPLELFIDGKPMQIARWPNAGDPHIPLDKVIDSGSAPRKGDYAGRPAIFAYGVERPQRWALAKGFSVSGIFHSSWADDTIEVAKINVDQGTFTTVHPHLYGLTNKPKNYAKWYALNLLEEIDQPGEYFVDAETDRVYFYPPVGIGSDSIMAVSMLEQPMIAIEGATGIELDGLTLEISRGSGVYIERGAENVVRGCTLRNLGILAVQVGKGVEPFPYGKHDGCGNKEDGQPGKPVSREMGSWHEHIYKFTAYNREAGTGHRIIGCDIYDTGAGGISLGGGDRKTLTPGNNAVINCDIHRVNRLDRTYKTMVNIDGVGNRIAHCNLHEGPGGAIYLHGNDHVIEYNSIGHILTDTSDMGAIYMGRDPSEVGSVIRHNYFHNIKNNIGGYGTPAIYFDDESICGADVLANVFYRIISGCVIVFNKGGNVPIENNIFIDCPKVIGGPIKNSTMDVRKFFQSQLGKERVRERVDITQPPYSEKYPHLLAIYQEKAPVVTKEVRSIITTASDPRFVDGAKGNFTLTPNAEVPEGFQRFDFNKIGLYIGDGRTVLPIASPTTRSCSPKGDSSARD